MGLSLAFAVQWCLANTNISKEQRERGQGEMSFPQSLPHTSPPGPPRPGPWTSVSLLSLRERLLSWGIALGKWIFQEGSQDEKHLPTKWVNFTQLCWSSVTTFCSTVGFQNLSPIIKAKVLNTDKLPYHFAKRICSLNKFQVPCFVDETILIDTTILVSNLFNSEILAKFQSKTNMNQAVVTGSDTESGI